MAIQRSKPRPGALRVASRQLHAKDLVTVAPYKKRGTSTHPVHNTVVIFAQVP